MKMFESLLKLGNCPREIGMSFCRAQGIARLLREALFRDAARTGSCRWLVARHVTVFYLASEKCHSSARIPTYQFGGHTEPTATRQRSVTISTDCIQEVDAALFF